MSGSNLTYVDGSAPARDAAALNGWQNEGNNLIQSGGETINTGVFDQEATAVSTLVHGANFYNDTGTGAAYTLTITSSVISPKNVTQYFNGMLVRFRPANDNTVTAPTYNVSTLGAKTITLPDGSPLALGDLSTSVDAQIRYDNASGNGFLLNPQVSTNSIGTIVFVAITTSGTYTKPAGLKYADILAQAAGGGAGGVDGQGAGTFAASAGGAGGGWHRATVAAADIGATEAVTIGAKGIGGTGTGNGTVGGNTSFGTLVSATGGSFSGGTIAQNAQRIKDGSVGGVGDGSAPGVKGRGATGGMCVFIGENNNQVSGGVGGFGYFGQGGSSIQGDNNGTDSATYGGGGGGASVTSATSANFTGGDGGDGVIYIWEYY